MTVGRLRLLHTVKRLQHTVIPAKAGIHFAVAAAFPEKAI
jgi:hypothetical protein